MTVRRRPVTLVLRFDRELVGQVVHTGRLRGSSRDELDLLEEVFLDDLSYLDNLEFVGGANGCHLRYLPVEDGVLFCQGPHLRLHFGQHGGGIVLVVIGSVDSCRRVTGGREQGAARGW